MTRWTGPFQVAPTLHHSIPEYGPGGVTEHTVPESTNAVYHEPKEHLDGMPTNISPCSCIGDLILSRRTPRAPVQPFVRCEKKLLTPAFRKIPTGYDQCTRAVDVRLVHARYCYIEVRP